MAEKKIGVSTFKVDRMAAREQQRLMLRLGKIVGPALTQLAGAFRIKDEAARDEAALGVVSSLIAGADVDEAESIVVELCQKAMIKDQGGAYEPVQFDFHFSDDLMTAWQVAYFVLEVNFRDFLSAAGRSGVGKAILASPPTTSRQ